MTPILSLVGPPLGRSKLRAQKTGGYGFQIRSFQESRLLGALPRHPDVLGPRSVYPIRTASSCARNRSLVRGQAAGQHSAANRTPLSRAQCTLFPCLSFPMHHKSSFPRNEAKRLIAFRGFRVMLLYILRIWGLLCGSFEVVKGLKTVPLLVEGPT